jgi:hypothetical protein
MTRTEHQKYDGLRIGQLVTVTHDDGFYSGQRTQHTIAKIVVVECTPEEQRRMGVPSPELFLFFTDGSSAGAYDRIRPCADLPTVVEGQ